MTAPVASQVMCGRYVSTAPFSALARIMGARVPDGQRERPSYNVAPTADIATVVEDDGERLVRAHHWGLVPFWAKDPKAGARMINARADGVATKPAYRAAFRRRRCLIPADGFYEWRKIPGLKAKQPFYIHPPEGVIYAFAGLWETWGPEDDQLLSATIITTDPNDTMATIHDRMPVILPATTWDQWLDPTNDDLDALQALLVPAPDELTLTRPVSTDVGNVRNDHPGLIAPAGH